MNISIYVNTNKYDKCYAVKYPFFKPSIKPIVNRLPVDTKKFNLLVL